MQWYKRLVDNTQDEFLNNVLCTYGKETYAETVLLLDLIHKKHTRKNKSGIYEIHERELINYLHIRHRVRLKYLANKLNKISHKGGIELSENSPRTPHELGRYWVVRSSKVLKSFNSQNIELDLELDLEKEVVVVVSKSELTKKDIKNNAPREITTTILNPSSKNNALSSVQRFEERFTKKESHHGLINYLESVGLEITPSFKTKIPDISNAWEKNKEGFMKFVETKIKKAEERNITGYEKILYIQKSILGETGLL